MPIKVPRSYAALVQEMSQGTGLSTGIINAQVMEESGYNATAVSPAGALGWLQFIPSTYAQYGGKPGTEFNPAAEAKVYIRFMNALLTMFHGNVRDALAAYNAGPGNIGAGMGYASEILGNYSGLAGTRPNPPPMDAHQLRSAHRANTTAAGRTPMNHPRLGAPNTGFVTPGGAGMRMPVGYSPTRARNVRTVTPGGAGMRLPVTSTLTAHQLHVLRLEHLAHLASGHTGQNLPARTNLTGGKTPPPSNRGTGGTRVVNR